MSKRILLSIVFALAALGSSTSQAQQAPQAGSIEFRNIAEVEVDARGADGKIEKKRVAAEKALPGAEVIYTSTFRNIGKRPAGNIVVVNPVPANTTLVGGSAFGDHTDITFSADGGKSWATADKVKVTAADGKQRPAGITEITHVRWAMRGELAPGKEGVVGFRVTVN